MKGLYTVRVPFAGWFDIEVEADNAESAIEQGVDNAGVCLNVEGENIVAQQWDIYRALTTGNTNNFDTNDAIVVGFEKSE